MKKKRKKRKNKNAHYDVDKVELAQERVLLELPVTAAVEHDDDIVVANVAFLSSDHSLPIGYFLLGQLLRQRHK